MNLDYLLQKSIELGTFFSAFAGLFAAIVMFEIKNKFGTGIIAIGFKHIAWGVALIGMAMALEALLFFIPFSVKIISLAKVLLLVIGTYIIVIGTKTTADKLEKISK